MVSIKFNIQSSYYYYYCCILIFINTPNLKQYCYIIFVMNMCIIEYL